MAGLHRQSRKKAEARSVDMSASAEVASELPEWVRPADSDCEESRYTLTLNGASPDKDRVKVRIVTHVGTGALVEFAVVQETFYRSEWRHVAVVDSSHDDEVHQHRYGRYDLDERVGDPEYLMPITCLADIQEGYNLAYDQVIGSWAENKRRWHDC